MSESDICDHNESWGNWSDSDENSNNGIYGDWYGSDENSDNVSYDNCADCNEIHRTYYKCVCKSHICSMCVYKYKMDYTRKNLKNDKHYKLNQCPRCTNDFNHLKVDDTAILTYLLEKLDLNYNEVEEETKRHICNKRNINIKPAIKD